MNALHASCVVLAFAATAAAQRAIATVFGPAIGGQTGDLVAAAGDMDGDSVPDFLVSSPYAGNGLVQIVSGAARTARNITNPVPGGWAGTTLISTPDMNLDGVRDLVFERSSTLLAYSGATGTLLWDTSGLGLLFDRAAAVGDVDQDGRGDLAAISVGSGNSYLRVLSGTNGTLIPGFLSISNGSTNAILAIGDITNDGRSEIARARYQGQVDIYSVAPMAFIRSIPITCSELGIADLAGNSRPELLGRSGSVLHVFDTTTGSTVRTFQNTADGQFAMLGDLDADTVPDFGWRTAPGNAGDAVELRSGRTGATIGRWLGRPGFTCVNLAGVGDVDGDGFGDVLIGDTWASAMPPAPATGGWQLVSGKILASMTYIPVQCAQGPWFPQLGITRPVIGQTVTIEGRDGPVGAMGALALSLQPPAPTYFGVAGCEAWWDVGNWAMLHQPSTPLWLFQVTIPNAPQLAGMAIALQAFYVPTASPIGFDLSNAVWARIGY